MQLNDANLLLLESRIHTERSSAQVAQLTEQNKQLNEQSRQQTGELQEISSQRQHLIEQNELLTKEKQHLINKQERELIEQAQLLNEQHQRLLSEQQHRFIEEKQELIQKQQLLSEQNIQAGNEFSTSILALAKENQELRSQLETIAAIKAQHVLVKADLQAANGLIQWHRANEVSLTNEKTA